MTTALTPAQALAYLGELTVGLRAAAVIGPDGALLAGDARLARRAAAAAADAPGVVRRAEGDGTLLAARGRDGTTVAVLAGEEAFLALLAHDVRRLVECLTGDTPAD